MISQLSQIGFRDSHVREALHHTNTFIDALEWLLFHVPEDDLPDFFTKRDEDSSLSLKISTDIKTEYILQRLAQSGYDKDEIQAALKECNGDEHLTAISLTHKIAGIEFSNSELSDTNLDLWIEELDGISAIGSNKVSYAADSKKIATLSLNISDITAGMLLVKLFYPTVYPDQFPGVQIIVNDASFKLASYIKLSIVRQLYENLQSNNLFGDCFLFSLVEWLENNITAIIKNPGSLVVNNSVSKSTKLIKSKEKNPTYRQKIQG